MKANDGSGDMSQARWKKKEKKNPPNPTLPSSIVSSPVLRLNFDCNYRGVFMAAVLNSVTLISVFQHALKPKHMSYTTKVNGTAPVPRC